MCVRARVCVVFFLRHSEQGWSLPSASPGLLHIPSQPEWLLAGWSLVLCHLRYGHTHRLTASLKSSQGFQSQLISATFFPSCVRIDLNPSSTAASRSVKQMDRRAWMGGGGKTLVKCQIRTGRTRTSVRVRAHVL